MTYGPIEPSEGRIQPFSSLDLASIIGTPPEATNAQYYETWEQDALPIGTQDNSLIGIAGYMRQKWRFSEQAIYHALTSLCSNGTLERDPSRRPYSDADMRRIARSAARYPVGEPTFEIEVPRVICEVPLISSPMEWWLYGFVPQGELVMLYGRKASGKSTFGSWLAGIVTRKNGIMLHIGIEEPYARFRVRAILGGADPKRILGWKGSLRLPDDVDALEEQVLAHGINLVYFDSIYSHFTAPRGTLENTRARSNLEPLASMAQRTGATVLANFHNRRSDDSYMGSTEMVNVGRVVLRLERRANENSRLFFEMGNFTEPDHALSLQTTTTTVMDPESGEIQMERQADGSLAPLQMQVVTSMTAIPLHSEVTSSQIEAARRASLIEAI